MKTIDLLFQSWEWEERDSFWVRAAVTDREYERLQRAGAHCRVVAVEVNPPKRKRTVQKPKEVPHD